MTNMYNLQIPKEVLFEVVLKSEIVTVIMMDLMNQVPEMFRIIGSDEVRESVVEYLLGTEKLGFEGKLGDRFINVLKRNLKVTVRTKSEQEIIAGKLRAKVRRVINQVPVDADFIKLLGCSEQEFLVHLQDQFNSGMEWSNYGKWHVDHIVPLCAFDLTNDEQVKTVSNFNNLRPLWARDNSKKVKLDRKQSIRKGLQK